MTAIMPFIECFLSINILLALTSLFLGGKWLFKQPSLKLLLARLMFISCFFSPIALCFMKQSHKPFVGKFISLDALNEYSLPILDQKKSIPLLIQSLPAQSIEFMDCWGLIFIFYSLGLLCRARSIISDLYKIQKLLRSATRIRSNGKLLILVSDQCLIPFSIRSFNKSYIVLPLPLLNSSTNVKIAIAHEGQHHRQNDCIWAYFMEFVRIACWWNLGVNRWHRILSELQELSCDEALVGHQVISAHDYGHCLFNVAQSVYEYSETYQRKFACAVGMAWDSENHEGSFITRRIYMLSHYRSSATHRSLFNVILVALVVLGPFSLAYAAKGAIAQEASKGIDTSSLDPKIQAIAVLEIADAVARYQATSGAIAIADPSTGKIIAFAEAGSTAKNAQSWKSRLFAPGSTIKPFIAAAAIDAGISSESKIYDCAGPYDVSGTKFINSEPNLGKLSLTEIMVRSVNTCMIKVAQDIGSERFRKKLGDFGFNVNSGWRTNVSDALQLANGATTAKAIPVNMETVTKAYTILANKGHLSSVNSESVISEATANSVTRMLVETVNHGTGRAAALPDIRVAGKTGTIDSLGASGSKISHLALFGGYVPADAPRFVIFVAIEDGFRIENKRKSNSGGSLAAPVFHEVAIKSLSLNK